MKETEYYKSGKQLENLSSARVKSVEVCKQNKAAREEIYLKNPKVCEECNGVIPYDKRVNKYCSGSCSTTASNRNRTRKNGNNL